MKRILHLIDSTETGGAETVFLDLIRHLDRTKYTPVIVIPGKGWVYDQLLTNNFTPFVIPAKGSFNLRFLIALIKLVRREKIDLIQAHLLGSNVYASLAGLLTRTPVIATFHGMVDVGVQERFIWMKQLILNLGSRRIVFVSHSLLKHLSQRMRFVTTKCTIIYNGVDFDRFNNINRQQVRHLLGIKENEICIISVGDIRESKGHNILIDAASRILCDHNNVKFVVAGDKSTTLGKKVIDACNKLGLSDKIIFLGYRNDIPDLLVAADIFALPSTKEGFSIATIEAMGASIPVIVTRSGGPEEIVSNDNIGILIPANNAKALANAIDKLIRNPGIRKKMSENALLHAMQTFSIKHMLNSYERIYDSLLAK